MEIIVFQTFWGPLTQDKFFVKTIDSKDSREYKGFYQAGEWNFQIYDGENLILESRIQKTLRQNYLFRYREYKIIWEGTEIGILKRSFRKKEIVTESESYPFPGLFRRKISHLNLIFPFSSWIYRRKVRAYCLATERNKVMLSIAMTVYFWFTWNALPAD